MVKTRSSRAVLLVNGHAIIPAGAQERVARRHANGAKAEAFYFVGRKRVGYRRWWQDGGLSYEWATEGKEIHGRWIEFDTNGVPQLEATYFNGRLHGVRTQFDRRGRLMGASEFQHGDGVDLWFTRRNWLSEEWHYQKGRIHGFERFWWGRRRLWREACWFDGLPHGITRRWDERGQMERGFPQYWIHNRQVTNAEYLNESLSDSNLLRYTESDDSPRRVFPERLVAKSAARVRTLDKRIDSLPLVAEAGEFNATLDDIFAFLRQSGPFPDLREGATWQIQNHIWCRVEQVTRSYIGIQWLDDRWKSSRFSRVSFDFSECGKRGAYTCFDFSHVGLPATSRKETRRFWMNAIFRPLSEQHGFHRTSRQSRTRRQTDISWWS